MTMRIKTIRSLILQSIRILCVESIKRNVIVEATESLYYLLMKTRDETAVLSPEDAQHIKQVWNDPGVKRIWGLRRCFQVADCCAYYFEALDRICEESYVPTFEDLAMEHTLTQFSKPILFTVSGHHFRIIDVGQGQCRERNVLGDKFNQATSIAFIASLTDSDFLLVDQSRLVQ
eukprot:TRINITY_DN5994_c0_g1_i1.p1 TRINITY_DN5994_c0_g1~~TRINITY_DN5994_c0_g1_i1.p1  ORF type:complete len:182 (-),score=39.23 TRINITY_DN5994_c0_g1_i1:492-1016(-)